MCTGRSFERLGNGSPRGMIAPQVSARGTGLGLQPTHRVFCSAAGAEEILFFQRFGFGALRDWICRLGVEVGSGEGPLVCSGDGFFASLARRL